jgi:hypothetical protein
MFLFVTLKHQINIHQAEGPSLGGALLKRVGRCYIFSYNLFNVI